jgi:hypothetical protein
MVICNLFYACRCFILSFDLQVYGDIHVYPIKPKYIQHNSNINGSWNTFRSLFIFWSLHCLPIFDLRLLFTTLVSSNFLCEKKIQNKLFSFLFCMFVQSSDKKNVFHDPFILEWMNSGMVHVSKLFYSCHKNKELECFRRTNISSYFSEIALKIHPQHRFWISRQQASFHLK